MSGTVRPGAEPFRIDAGPVGALLLHGFSGSPASLRPMGEWLAAHGVSVAGPRLPGHGTDDWHDLASADWIDWEREALAGADDLGSRCRATILVGLSMGGGLALHLAAMQPARFAGVVAINPYVRDPRLLAAPVLKFARPSVRGVGNDIAKPGQDEICNERLPTATLASLSSFLRTVERELPRVTAPLLLFSSAEDHTVDPANSRLVAARAGSAHKDLVRLARSFHVATLDHDAPGIFERTLAFIREVAGLDQPEG